MVLRAIVVGSGAYFVSIMLSSLWAMQSDAMGPAGRTRTIDDISVSAALSITIAGPIIETLIYPLVRLAAQLSHKPRQETMFVMTSSAAIGWLLHGADGFAVGRALAFAMLAHLYVTIATRHGSRWAFAITAFAHICWNSLAIALALMR